LQQIDTRLHDLERERDALDSGAELRARVEVARAEMQAAGDALRAMETELRDTELQIKTHEAKKKDFEDRLYSGRVRNPKEIDDMQREVKMLGEHVDRLVDKALNLMERIEPRRAAAARMESELREQEAELARVASSYESETARIAAEMAALNAQRAQLVPGVPADLLRRYDELRARRANLGIVMVAAETCPGCRIALSVDTMRQLKRGARVFCESCGRILYWPNVEAPLNAPPREQ
jgi:hypothetical protein